MGELLATLIGWAMLLGYVFIAYRFFVRSIQMLVQYYKDEQRPYEIVPGTIVDFEMRRVGRPRSSGKKIIFYPVFEFEWKGKRRRGFARRVGARFGKGLKPVPATSLQIGDSVNIRVFPQKPRDARIDEAHYFWKSRIWVQFLTVPLTGAMLIYGVYAIICQLIPG